MANKTYTINGKEYSKEQLIVIGKQHYPKFNLIPRIIGIFLFSIGLLVCGLLGIVLLILNVAGVFTDPEFPIWVFFIPLGVFGTLVLAGIICFICSFIRKSDEAYIQHAIKYLTKLEINNKNIDIDKVLNPRDQEELARNERLLKGGVISQEEFDRRKEELFK